MTEPILDYYRSRGIYAGIEANQAIPKVWSDLKQVFNIN
jgi:adenylate kinase family enzyme